ncbi:hypothetical protein BJV78DRAFT_837860 [Lactifluus subvellereus]|nr:hypothetical protein BJV78DRAFT_837860 [Lactifluus subvellereus]
MSAERSRFQTCRALNSADPPLGTANSDHLPTRLSHTSRGIGLLPVGITQMKFKCVSTNRRRRDWLFLSCSLAPFLVYLTAGSAWLCQCRTWVVVHVKPKLSSENLLFKFSKFGVWAPCSLLLSMDSVEKVPIFCTFSRQHLYLILCAPSVLKLWLLCEGGVIRIRSEAGPRRNHPSLYRANSSQPSLGMDTIPMSLRFFFSSRLTFSCMGWCSTSPTILNILSITFVISEASPLKPLMSHGMKSQHSFWRP